MVHGQATVYGNLQVMLRRSWWLTKCILWSCTKNSRDVKFLVLFQEVCWHCGWYAPYRSLWQHMIPRKRVNLSSSVTTILVLASLTPSTPGFNLTSLVAINLSMLSGIHLHPLCPPLVFLGDQSWGICSFYRAMHFSAKRGIAIACRLSVCLSVCL